MSILVSGFGKVKAIASFSRGSFSGTEVKVYCKTGEKKKEGEAYAPGQNYKITLTEAQGSALSKQQIEEGSTIFFSGTLVMPYLFQGENGDLVAIQQLSYGKVEKIYTDNEEKETPVKEVISAPVDIVELPF